MTLGTLLPGSKSDGRLYTDDEIVNGMSKERPGKNVEAATLCEV